MRFSLVGFKKSTDHKCYSAWQLRPAWMNHVPTWIGNCSKHILPSPTSPYRVINVQDHPNMKPALRHGVASTIPIKITVFPRLSSIQQLFLLIEHVSVSTDPHQESLKHIMDLSNYKMICQLPYLLFLNVLACSWLPGPTGPTGPTYNQASSSAMPVYDAMD